jgi:hypothetical protein
MQFLIDTLINTNQCFAFDHLMFLRHDGSFEDSLQPCARLGPSLFDGLRRTSVSLRYTTVEL